MHPFKKYAHKNDPAWIRGVQKYVEESSSDDITATIRNHGGDRKVTAKASYDIDQEKK